MSRGHACEIDRLHGEWLLWTCCDATDECLVRALLNRAVALGLAGCDVGPRLQPKHQNSECGFRVLFDTPGHRFMRRQEAASTWGFGAKMCFKTQRKALETPASAAYPKFELARLGD